MWDVHCGTWQPNQKATCRRPCQALYATLYADENGWNGSQEEEIPFNIFTPLRPWSLLTFVCFTCLSSCLHCTFSMSYFVLFFFFCINFTASYEFYPCTYSINLWWRVLWSWEHWRFVDTPEYCPLFHSQMLAGMPFIHPSTSHRLPLIQGQARVAVGQAR